MSVRTALVTLAALVGSAAAAAHCDCDALGAAKKFQCMDAKASDAAACSAAEGTWVEDDASGAPAAQACNAKAVRQLCKAAFNEELDCSTDTKLAQGKECTDCADDWTDKSGCQVTCVLMSATYGEATPEKVAEMKAKCQEANEDRTGPADDAAKKTAFQELLDAWENKKGGSQQALDAAAKVGSGSATGAGEEYKFKQLLRHQ